MRRRSCCRISYRTNLRLLVLTQAQISVSNNHVYCKLGNDHVRDLTQDNDTIYVHPTAKQCSYSYEHPSEKQCKYEPDLSAYITRDEFESSGGANLVIGSVSTDRNYKFTINFSKAFNVVWICPVNDAISDARQIYQPIMITRHETTTSKNVYCHRSSDVRLLYEMSLSSTHITARFTTSGLSNISDVRYVAWLQ